MAGRSPLITVVTQTLYKVSKTLLRDFGEVEKLQVSRKGPADFVSSADHRTEKALVGELRRALALITRPNAPSEALHQRLGFELAGVWSEVGRKFDRYWDVAVAQRPIRLSG